MLAIPRRLILATTIAGLSLAGPGLAQPPGFGFRGPDGGYVVFAAESVSRLLDVVNPDP